MDVKFINPFIYGTMDVMEKMAFTTPSAGKPFAKVNDAACGDISGIIGMTGDATGSLALSFSEACIVGLVGRMLGEHYTEINRAVLDAVGELTNMISGSSRKLMEKDDLKVFAAIPTVVFGKAHSVRHVVKGPSIVIPFETQFGAFVIDVCLKTNVRHRREAPARPGGEPFSATIFEKPSVARPAEKPRPAFDPKAHNPAVFARTAPPQAKPDILQERIEKDLTGRVSYAQHSAAERIDALRRLLAEINQTRDEILKQLKDQPFMEIAQRQRYKKALPAYDAKIKRLKLDIAAAEMLLRMPGEEREQPAAGKPATDK